MLLEVWKASGIEGVKVVVDALSQHFLLERTIS